MFPVSTCWTVRGEVGKDAEEIMSRGADEHEGMIMRMLDISD